MKPYIGITGVMTPHEAHALISPYPHGAAHHLMIGVLVSRKTLRSTPQTYLSLFPPMADVPKVFQDDERCLNLVHYSTDTPQTLNEELALLNKQLRHAPVDGIQLNVVWPPTEEVRKYREHQPGYRIVLQIPPTALQDAAARPDFLVDRVGALSPYLTDVLLDASAGRGTPLELATLLPPLQALSKAFPALGLGVAGGLSPSTLHLVEPLVREFPALSINAQAGLRDRITRNLDLAVAHAYLAQALTLFQDAALAPPSIRPSPFVRQTGNPNTLLDL